MPTAWRLATRIAFRFCFAYFSLYVLLTQMLTTLVRLPVDSDFDPGTLPPLRQIIIWTAQHVFGVTRELVWTGSGSGDKTYDWIEVFCLLMFALAATIIWSIADRRRKEYATLHKWFYLFLRFSLGSTLLLYGAIKAVPIQMGTPSLMRLIEPFGQMSPMGVLWASIAAAPSYQIFAGTAECIAGVLLLFPRTALLGALIGLVDMTQVFALNMTYDVPVKLFSFHLILMSLVLIAPDAKRLMRFLLLNQPVEASARPSLFQSARRNRIALAVQVVAAVYLVAVNFYNSGSSWFEYGGGAPRSILYGVWNVEEHALDGRPRPALLTDAGRWRRLIFDRPEYVTVQKMDDTTTTYGVRFDAAKKVIALSAPRDKSWQASWSYERREPDELVLDGQMDGHQVHATLRLFEREKFLLVNRGFNWIQEYPFNK